MDTGTLLLTVPQEYIGSFAEALGAQLTSYGVSAGDGLEVRAEQRGGLQVRPGPTKLTWHLPEHGTAGMSGKDEATWHCQGIKCMLPPHTGGISPLTVGAVPAITSS